MFQEIAFVSGLGWSLRYIFYELYKHGKDCIILILFLFMSAFSLRVLIRMVICALWPGAMGKSTERGSAGELAMRIIKLAQLIQLITFTYSTQMRSVNNPLVKVNAEIICQNTQPNTCLIPIIFKYNLIWYLMNSEDSSWCYKGKLNNSECPACTRIIGLSAVVSL